MTTEQDRSQVEAGGESHVSGEKELEQLGYRQELRRTLSLVGNLALVVAGITPATSLLIIGPVALALAGTGAFWAYLIAAVVAFCMALCFAELGSVYRTGMICHEFKGGIGTVSRQLSEEEGGWTVGTLVQANCGRRNMLRVDGAPVGRVLTTERIPTPLAVLEGEDRMPAGSGSIIVVLATDAPLLPGQCDRLAQRAGIGLARAGGGVDDGSGDLFLAFATGNRGIPRAGFPLNSPATVPLRMVPSERMTPLFEAAAEATEEAILNALSVAGTVTGRDGITAHGLTADLLLGALDEARALHAHR